MNIRGKHQNNDYSIWKNKRQLHHGTCLSFIETLYSTSRRRADCSCLILGSELTTRHRRFLPNTNYSLRVSINLLNLSRRQTTSAADTSALNKVRATTINLRNLIFLQCIECGSTLFTIASEFIPRVRLDYFCFRVHLTPQTKR
jgi:hypothetical protein